MTERDNLHVLLAGYKSSVKLTKHNAQKIIPNIVMSKIKELKTSRNCLFVNKNIVTNKTSIAEIFNNFLVNVDSNVTSKIAKVEKPCGKYLKKEF